MLPIDVNPFGRLPAFDITINAGSNTHSSISHSIDCVQHKRQDTSKSTTTSSQFDFSSFPNIIAPNTMHTNGVSSSLCDRTIDTDGKPYSNGAAPSFVSSSSSTPVHIKHQTITSHTHTQTPRQPPSQSQPNGDAHNSATKSMTSNQQALSALFALMDNNAKTKPKKTHGATNGGDTKTHANANDMNPELNLQSVAMPMSTVAPQPQLYHCQPTLYQPLQGYTMVQDHDGEQKLLIPVQQYYNANNSMYWPSTAATPWYSTSYASHPDAVAAPPPANTHPIACNDS